MPCKHEGGTEKCIRDKQRRCYVRQKQLYRAFYLANLESCRRKSREHEKNNVLFGSKFTGRDRGKSTAACELLVRADLSKRGFEVTVPVSPTAQHDLHVELPSVGWKGVQVKAAKLRLKSGVLAPSNGKPGMSPIFVLVYLPTNRIEYRAGTEPLPVELR